MILLSCITQYIYTYYILTILVREVMQDVYQQQQLSKPSDAALQDETDLAVQSGCLETWRPIPNPRLACKRRPNPTDRYLEPKREYVKQWRVGLFVKALGNDFPYFWGAGDPQDPAQKSLEASIPHRPNQQHVPPRHVPWSFTWDDRGGIPWFSISLSIYLSIYLHAYIHMCICVCRYACRLNS